MNTSQISFTDVEYSKNSFQQDEKDSGYTDIGFPAINQQFQDQNLSNNIEMDTENNYIYEEETAGNTFLQECESDASDFYPSDPEDVPFISSNVSMEEKRKKYQNRGLKIFRDLTENLAAPWKDELDPNNAFLSNMYKFNDEKKRWVKKGPVAIFILPKQFRLVTYNLYGQQTPSLNIKLWEFMSKYSKATDRMFLFNSFGRNFKNKVFIDTSIVYLRDMVDISRLTEKEKSLIHNEKVNICSSTVIPYPEDESSKIIFSFRMPEELLRFKNAFNKVCSELYINNCQERYYSYLSEQPVLNYQGNPIDKLCKYPYVNNELFVSLSKCGFAYKPIENENGELLNSRVVCSFCGATYSGWFGDVESIETVHRQHHNAIQYNCPYIY
ncbi:hypothetical protein BCR36DRAFT_336799 [Piromyces finnis]|uniref:Uncharacterized protein n=1 Tax=Piromyces finnis TaxID=1754191 RepID=A0A1Y1UXB7_9FUNG|nr:hypothetical protein BCR36DRAFT_336799 [Piromyces finnis]|eukprot:ORX42826.1 hypothetical protein BCR36DRAFT_336799 [Piromyces finnis]